MKKTKKYLAVLLCLVCGCIVYYAYCYYAPPQMRQPFEVPEPDDTLRIAYIGDSWAFMHKDEDCRIVQMLEDSISRPVRVYSYGICGLTSKEIYESLFDHPQMKAFIQQRGYEYCFVSAGINDTYKKMSLSYYKKSMDAIIQFLLENRIHPIILEIPDYDIQKSYERQSLPKKILRHVSMLISGVPIDCKQQFRDALMELIQEKHYTDKVTVISYKSWNSDYAHDQKSLYRSDGLHLNDTGYAVLDSVTAMNIINSISRSSYCR